MQEKQIDFLVIAAMKEELAAFSKHLDDVEELSDKSFHGILGVLDGKRVFAALSGVGKINAAVTASYFIQKFQPRYVLNIGSAGGLQPNQKVGEFVVSTTVLSHDFDIGIATPEDPRFQYHADAYLLDVVKAALTDLNQVSHIGLVVTGDQFVTNDSYAFRRIQTVYPEAVCTEMEAASIAGACTRFEVPFVVVRALSDVPVYKNNEETFEEFLEYASIQSALLCATAIKKVRV